MFHTFLIFVIFTSHFYSLVIRYLTSCLCSHSFCMCVHSVAGSVVLRLSSISPHLRGMGSFPITGKVPAVSVRSSGYSETLNMRSRWQKQSWRDVSADLVLPRYHASSVWMPKSVAANALERPWLGIWTCMLRLQLVCGALSSVRWWWGWRAWSPFCSLCLDHLKWSVCWWWTLRISLNLRLKGQHVAF